MSPLPVVSGRQVVKALQKLDYVLDRQRGSLMPLRQIIRLLRLQDPGRSPVQRAEEYNRIRIACVSIGSFADTKTESAVRAFLTAGQQLLNAGWIAFHDSV